MVQRAQDRIEQRVQFLDDVLGKETQHQKAVLLQQAILAPVAPVCDRVRQVTKRGRELFTKRGRGAFVLGLLFAALSGTASAQTCRVLDPELQGSYKGGCNAGLAEGYGEARGSAEYRGGFSAGRKHGNGIKIWPRETATRANSPKTAASLERR